MVVAGCGGGVAEAQRGCANAMMGYVSRQCGSGIMGYTRVGVEVAVPK